MPFSTSDNNYGVAKFIVNSTAGLGSHTTLATAMAAASSGDTIFLMSSVTENVTITPGVNITAWTEGTLNTPSITGTLTMTGAGTSTLSGLELITNSAAIIAVTGSAASILNVNNCYLNCSNNTGITFSTSNASAEININRCLGNIGTTGITLFSHSSAGSLIIRYSTITNTGAATTASTVSAGSMNLNYSTIQNPITTSSTGGITLNTSTINTSATNSTSLTIGGSGSSACTGCYFLSGSASAISISQTFGLINSTISSSNTNAVTGAGTITYSGVIYNGASFLINTTTQSGGVAQGLRNAVAPAAGFIGEQISSAVISASAVSLSTGTYANVTSISLTAGIWDISAVIGFTGTPTGGTQTNGGISLNSASATGANSGDAKIQTPTLSTATSDHGYSIPSYRKIFSATTTVYLIANAVFTGGSISAYGRISATRVG